MHRWWGSATSGLEDRRRGLAEDEGVYNRYDQRKSVTQFSLKFLSLTAGVHKNKKDEIASLRSQRHPKSFFDSLLREL
jgi:hypothetical protein